MKTQVYWEDLPRHEVSVVVVLSCWKRLFCKHDWRGRVNDGVDQHGDNWSRVCRKCGACAR